MPSSLIRIHKSDQIDAGFSLVEVVISALLLLASTVAIASIFDFSILSLRRSSERDAVAAAISADMAAIELLNEYYTCDSGSGTCNYDESQQTMPSKHNYAPGKSDTGWATFKQLCDTPTTSASTGISSALITKLSQVSAISTPINGQVIPIPRSVKPHPDNNKPEPDTNVIYPRHLYIVEWSPPQGSKRELVLTPTVANWCP